MNTWARKSLKVGVLSAGILLFAGGTAQANDWHAADNAEGGNRVEAMETSDNSGIGNGNQVAVPVEIPILLCGTSVGVLGEAQSACLMGDKDHGDYESARGEGWDTSDNGGLLSGNQLLADVDVPVTLCGNAVAVAGDAAAACSADGGDRGHDENFLGGWETGDNHGILTGNQIAALVDVPITLCGNAVGVLGDAAAACDVDGNGDHGDDDNGGWDGDGDGGGDGDDDGDGDANGDGDGGGDGDDSDGDDNGYDDDGDGTGGGDGDDIDGDDSDGDGGVSGAYGDPARAGAEQLPVFDSLFGLDKATNVVPLGKTLGGTESARHGDGSGWHTGDNGGVLTGNQVLADVDIPVKVVGNAISVLGGDSAAVVR